MNIRQNKFDDLSAPRGMKSPGTPGTDLCVFLLRVRAGVRGAAAKAEPFWARFGLPGVWFPQLLEHAWWSCNWSSYPTCKLYLNKKHLVGGNLMKQAQAGIFFPGVQWLSSVFPTHLSLLLTHSVTGPDVLWEWKLCACESPCNFPWLEKYNLSTWKNTLQLLVKVKETTSFTVWRELLRILDVSYTQLKKKNSRPLSFMKNEIFWVNIRPSVKVYLVLYLRPLWQIHSTSLST